MDESLNRRVVAQADVLFRVVGQEAVILNMKTEQYLGLDAVGIRMWTLLHGEPTIQGAFDALLAEFAVDPERLRSDLNEFLKQLQNHGLIILEDCFDGSASQ